MLFSRQVVLESIVVKDNGDKVIMIPFTVRANIGLNNNKNMRVIAIIQL